MNKSICFLIAVILVVFSFNISYSQDVSIDDVLDDMTYKLQEYLLEIDVIHKDLKDISLTVQNSNSSSISTVIVANNVLTAGHHYVFYLGILYTKEYIDKNKLKSYYYFILNMHKLRQKDLNHRYEGIQKVYPYINNMAALHSTDKAKKLLLDSIDYIESTMQVLETKIESMP